jgi:hypothetical protein
MGELSDPNQWSACRNIRTMLVDARQSDYISLRTLRLFRSTCFSLLLDEESDPLIRQAVVSLELYAEGRISSEDYFNLSEAVDNRIEKIREEWVSIRSEYDSREYMIWYGITYGYRADLIQDAGRLNDKIYLYSFITSNLFIGTVDTVSFEINWLLQDIRRLIQWLASLNQGHPDVEVRRMELLSQIPDPTYLDRERISPIYVASITQEALLCVVLREILGNPYSPRPRIPNNESVISTARVIYESREFERLPELGSALEDAGCEDSEVLLHCQRADSRIRGSWVVDALLGKN